MRFKKTLSYLPINEGPRWDTMRREGRGPSRMKAILTRRFHDSTQTTFVKRHLTGEFEKKYIATLGVDVHPLGFTTVSAFPPSSLVPSTMTLTLYLSRTSARFSSMFGTPLVRRSLAVSVMDTTSTASAVLSCSTLPAVSPTRMFPTGTVCFAHTSG